MNQGNGDSVSSQQSVKDDERYSAPSIMNNNRGGSDSRMAGSDGVSNRISSGNGQQRIPSTMAASSHTQQRQQQLRQPDVSRNKRKRGQPDSISNDSSSSDSISLALIPLHPAACKLAPPQQRGNSVASNGGASGDGSNASALNATPDTGGLSLILPSNGMKPLPLVLGRTNLANWWWKSCPCQHYCRLHCRPVAQNIKSLSKVMIQLDTKGRVRVAGKNPHLVTVVSPTGVATTLNNTDAYFDGAHDGEMNENCVDTPVVLNVNDIISIGRRDREPWMRFQVIPYVKPSKRPRLPNQQRRSRISASAGSLPAPTPPVSQGRRALSRSNDKLDGPQGDVNDHDNEIKVLNKAVGGPGQAAPLEPANAAAAVAAAVAAKFGVFGSRNPPAVEEIDESPTNSSTSVNHGRTATGKRPLNPNDAELARTTTTSQQQGAQVTTKSRARPQGTVDGTNASKRVQSVGGSALDANGQVGGANVLPSSRSGAARLASEQVSTVRNVLRNYNNASSTSSSRLQRKPKIPLMGAAGNVAQKKSNASAAMNSQSERQKAKRRQEQQDTFGGHHPHVHLLYQKYKTSAGLLVKSSKRGGGTKTRQQFEQKYNSDGQPIPCRRSFFLPPKQPKKDRTSSEAGAVDVPSVPVAASANNTSSRSAVADATTALVNAYAAFGNTNAQMNQSDVSPAGKSMGIAPRSRQKEASEAMGSETDGDKASRNRATAGNGGDGSTQENLNQDDSFSGSSIISSSSPATQPNYSSNNNKADDMIKRASSNDKRLLDGSMPRNASTTGPYVVEIVLPPRYSGNESDKSNVEANSKKSEASLSGPSGQVNQGNVSSKLRQNQLEEGKEASPASSEKQCGQDERHILRLEHRIHAEETKGKAAKPSSSDEGNSQTKLENSQGNDESRQPIEESSSMLSMPHCSFAAGTACSSAPASTVDSSYLH